MAKHATGLDATELQLPAAKEITLPPTGALKKGLGADLLSIEVVDKPIGASHMEELAFAEEKVEVMVHESTDPYAENPVQIGVNGVNQFFARGVPQIVKRKFVEVLARAKKSHISTPEVTMAGGERTAAIRKVSALHYPFSIIRDDNPRGSSWLRGIMQEG